MYLGTLQEDPGNYIPPNRSKEHAIPRHMVESLALGLHPSKNHHHHIRGDRWSHTGDGGKKAHQTVVAHITLDLEARVPKDFGTERHIALEGQTRHIIIAALYASDAPERHFQFLRRESWPSPWPD